MSNILQRFTLSLSFKWIVFWGLTVVVLSKCFLKCCVLIPVGNIWVGSLAWFIKVLKQMTLHSRRENRVRKCRMNFLFRRTGLSSCLIIGFSQVTRKADCSLLIQENTLSLPYQAVVSARQWQLWGLIQGQDSPAIDGAIHTLQNQAVLWSLIYKACAEKVLT